MLRCFRRSRRLASTFSSFSEHRVPGHRPNHKTPGDRLSFRPFGQLKYGGGSGVAWSRQAGGYYDAGLVITKHSQYDHLYLSSFFRKKAISDQDIAAGEVRTSCGIAEHQAPYCPGMTEPFTVPVYPFSELSATARGAAHRIVQSPNSLSAFRRAECSGSTSLSRTRQGVYRAWRRDAAQHLFAHGQKRRGGLGGERARDQYRATERPAQPF